MRSTGQGIGLFAGNVDESIESQLHIETFVNSKGFRLRNIVNLVQGTGVDPAEILAPPSSRTMTCSGWIRATAAKGLEEDITVLASRKPLLYDGRIF